MDPITSIRQQITRQPTRPLEFCLVPGRSWPESLLLGHSPRSVEYFILRGFKFSLRYTACQQNNDTKFFLAAIFIIVLPSKAYALNFDFHLLLIITLFFNRGFFFLSCKYRLFQDFPSPLPRTHVLVRHLPPQDPSSRAPGSEPTVPGPSTMLSGLQARAQRGPSTKVM